MTGLRRGVVIAAVLGLGLAIGGCTADKQPPVLHGFAPGTFRLVAFDTCDDALAGLRAAASAVVGPYGFGGAAYAIDDVGGAIPPVPAPQAASGQSDSARSSTADKSTAEQTDYSGTNSYEAGADEPDLVKTDGQRIVTVANGRLQIVDAATKRVAGSVDLADPDRPDADPVRYTEADLLLSGDRALVLFDEPTRNAKFAGDRVGGVQPVSGTRAILVGLSGTPKVLSRLHVDANLVDARQTGSLARIVLRSSPRIAFPFPQNANDAQRTAMNQAIINQAGLDDWLPQVDVTTGGTTARTKIGCDAINRPETYSGTSVLTVLSFDLGQSALSNGQPVLLVADGDTVYSTGPSLYIASDLRWKPRGVGIAAKPADAQTQLYKFDTSGAKPVFAAGGAIPGYLINQYALSEWHGALRAASTSEGTSGGAPLSRQSGVYVLTQDGEHLRLTGSVQGLGKGEQIYAVRFAGPAGYVVTFRQTDPLYTVDLSDPAHPTVRGELKIPGYSAYLHPADGTRLIGVGQNGTAQGRVTGTQVSLFDVGNLAAPARLASYSVTGGHSEAEFDPHAFLYWPQTGLLVLPLQAYGAVATTGPTSAVGGSSTVDYKSPPLSGALVLRVTGTTITEVGFLTQPETQNKSSYLSQIRRSLLIGRTLWTVSSGGLMASDATTLAQQAWLPFS